MRPWLVGEFIEGDRFCSNNALKFILPAALGIGSAVVGPELLGALGPAEAAGAGTAATLADTAGGLSAADLLAAPATTAAGETAALGAPVTTSFVESALPATSPLLTTAPAVGPGSVSGIGAASGLDAALGPPPGVDVANMLTTSAEPVPGASQNVPPSLQPITTAPPPAPTAPVGAGSPAPGAAASAPAAPASVGPSVADIVSSGGTATVGGDTVPGVGPATLTQTQGTPGTGGLNDILRGTGTALKDATPFLGPAAALGGLALAIMRNNQPTPYTPQVAGAAGNISNIGPQIGSAATNLITQGQGLENYLSTGTLPPGVKQGIDQATQQAKATITSRYAASGESGSSAEAADLANVDSTAASQGAQLALNLYNSGVSEVASGVSALGQDAQTQGIAANLYQYLLEQALNKDQQLGNAIGSFASSLVPATSVRVAAA